jgi:hypothetical protein
VEKVKQEIEKPKVAVVGKIDLDTLNQKTRPDKKKKAVEVKVEEQPVVQKKLSCLRRQNLLFLSLSKQLKLKLKS